MNITFSVDDLAKKMGLNSYDPAIPLEWSNDVKEQTGLNPWTYGFVWCYDKSIYGEPVPLTERAKIILQTYSHIKPNFFYNYVNVEVFSA